MTRVNLFLPKMEHWSLTRQNPENSNLPQLTSWVPRAQDNSYMQKHIDAILALDLVDVNAIKKKKFKIVVDAVNSTGASFVPEILKALGVAAKDIIVLNGEVNGRFAHNPEPLPQNLSQLSNEVNKTGAHLGIAVDPDVDRLVLVCEDGSMFGEEYTLVAVSDYVLSKRPGNTVEQYEFFTRP
jgi:phosphomannomutase